MEFAEFNDKLYACFKENRVDDLLDGHRAKQLFDFANILAETNKVMNLTAITDCDGIIFKHFCDCAKVCAHIEKNQSVIDVGCGAGFPSLPLAILREDLKITSLDSTAKKVEFIKRTAEMLKLGNIGAVSARAEEFSRENRERFDCATSRAVARLNILSELCLPLVKVGGKFVPMKASKADEEMSEAAAGIKTLGGELISTDSYMLTYNGESLERCIYEIRKTHKTSPKYPREYKQILKKPL